MSVCDHWTQGLTNQGAESCPYCEIDRLNAWADGITNAHIKERHTAEMYQRELREELAERDATIAEQAAQIEVARETLREVVRISDRKHDAWDRAHAFLESQPSAALAKIKADALREAEVKLKELHYNSAANILH